MPVVLPPADPGEAGWEEVYGPDFPYSWLTAGQPVDAPVLSNSLCRVRYEASNQAGFSIDVWDVTAGVWEEQGKVLVGRSGDAGIVYPDLVSASVLEWSPDRAVVSLIMIAADDPRSRERVLISLQRGWTGPRFEVYGPTKADGSQPGLFLSYYVPPGDPNCTVAKFDAGGTAIAATAGSGSGLFSLAVVGASTFTGENDIALLRQGAGRQVNIAVVQAAAACVVDAGPEAYGTPSNFVQPQSSAAGYLSAHVGFCDQAADQILEAETIVNGSSPTASVAALAGASGGSVVHDTQSSDANASTLKAGTDLKSGAYRALARVQVGLAGSGTGDYQAFTATTSTGVVSSTSHALTWIDLGDLPVATDGPDLAVNVWEATAGGPPALDRIELVRLHTSDYTGARDLGQSVLFDARVGPRRVQRATA